MTTLQQRIVALTEAVRDKFNAVSSRIDNLPVAEKDKAMAYMNAADNCVANSWMKVPLDTLSFDAGGMWDSTNKRFTPTKAGYYQCNIRVGTETSGTIGIGVGKNGSVVKTCGAYGSLMASGGSALIYCNGTTDYLELFVFATSVRAFTTGITNTYMDVFGPV